jgi:Gp5 N-terminal OB domain
MSNSSLGSNMEMWVGEVRDIRDPDKGGGKVKVIVHGQHNAGEEAIPDDKLPWAHCLMNNSPSLNGVGHSVNYMPGSTVIGFWMDPKTKQIPVIIGSLHRSALPE